MDDLNCKLFDWYIALSHIHRIALTWIFYFYTVSSYIYIFSHFSQYRIHCENRLPRSITGAFNSLRLVQQKEWHYEPMRRSERTQSVHIQRDNRPESGLIPSKLRERARKEILLHSLRGCCRMVSLHDARVYG